MFRCAGSEPFAINGDAMVGGGVLAERDLTPNF
jgi:hypothetical protein